MTSQTRVAELSNASLPGRVTPDATADFLKSRAFLVLVITPALILFMSRKAVDHAPTHAASHRQYSEQWPSGASADASAKSGRAGFQPRRAALKSFGALAPEAGPAKFPGSLGVAPSVSPNIVYSRAMFLASEYDSRPYWKYPKLEVGAPTNRATADLVIEHLIPCESMGKPLNRVDTNGKMSYGILQFQDWDEWERISGITGSPDNRADSIRMAEWAIQNGMINHWTCAQILKIT